MTSNRGGVTMAKQADVRLLVFQPGRRLRCHLPFFIQHMAEGDLQPASSKNSPPGEPAGFILVHIAGYRRHRRKALQTLNHVLVANVAGMEDFLYRGKIPLEGWIVETMRIRDHPDPQCPTFHQRLAGAPADF